MTEVSGEKIFIAGLVLLEPYSLTRAIPGIRKNAENHENLFVCHSAGKPAPRRAGGSAHQPPLLQPHDAVHARGKLQVVGGDQRRHTG